MASDLRAVDVVVIGLGGAGGVAVLPVARAGLKVAAIEAGTWIDPHTFRADEIYNLVRRKVTTSHKAQLESPTVRRSPTEPARRMGSSPNMNAIGGSSIHYWGQSWRLKPWDFKTRSEVTKRYGASAIPAGSTLQDWPMSYEDLEPYYDIVEHEVGVSGKAGNIQGKLDPRGNIFEGPRRREYPMPPLRATDFTNLMSAAARKLGWHPFQAPAAINTRESDRRPSCAYHGNCDTAGCHISAKNSTAVSTIPRALQTKNLTIFDRAVVRRIVSGPDGRASGVRYVRDGQEYFQPARVVLLCSFNYENSRLLLLSKSKAYPNGLSNNHGQVGKHYFGHWGTSGGGGVSALFPFDLNIWYGLPAQGATVDDWADDSFDHAGLGFIGGSSLHVHTEMHPVSSSAMNTFGRAPQWGAQWKAFICENAARHVSSYHQTNTFPYETTFLDLDPEGRDPLGDPVIRITSPMRENERRATEYAQAKMEEWFRAAGAIEVRRSAVNPPGISNHAYGGTRMGDDVDTSVVNRWCFSHEVPNLGILGGSVMVTERRTESNTHHTSFGMAYGGPSCKKLEFDFRLSRPLVSRNLSADENARPVVFGSRVRFAKGCSTRSDALPGSIAWGTISLSMLNHILAELMKGDNSLAARLREALGGRGITTASC